MRFLNKIKRHFYNKWNWDMDEKLMPNFMNWFVFYLFRKKLKVLNITETINYVLQNNCSVARFGNGEFDCVFGGGNGYQKHNKVMAERLREILTDKTSRECLVCIPNIDEIYKDFNDDSKLFWKKYIRQNGRKLYRIICRKRVFGAAHFTRFYLLRKDKTIVAENIKQIRQIWEKKDILIVEGSLSKLGVCNDLFENASSVKRIIVPSKDAYKQYDNILQTVLSFYNGEIILMSIGSAATILAYDLSKRGIRALDVGHLDIEYMWFQMGAKERISIKGKHTAELSDDFSELDAEEETKYRSQIIATIN